MKKKTIVIMSPTYNRAIYEWKLFMSRWSPIIKKANRARLCIELLSGHKIYFKGKTEGQRALLGLRADITSVDEFVMPQESEGRGMNTHDVRTLLDNLETARIYAGAEFERLCNENQHIDACVFQSIRDSIAQNIQLLQSYVVCKAKSEE